MQTNFRLIPIILLILSACSNKPDSPVVARWKEHSLYADEFQKQYINYASSNPVRDSQTQRLNYAKYMLEQKIIATIGKKAKLDTLREVRTDIKLKKDHVLRQQYMRSIMESRVKYPEEMEIREAFRKKNTAILLEQIFAKSGREIDSLDALLKSGADFEQLARASMRKYNPDEPDSTYKMGWITYGNMDLAPEEVAFQLKDGERSRPVKSLNGWHIFRAQRVKTTEQVNVTAYQSERESLGFNLYRRRFEEKTQLYLDSVLNSLPLEINNATLKQVWKKIEPWKKNASAENLAIILTIEAGRYTDSELPRNTPLAKVDGAIYTVGQFLDQLQSLPAYLLQPNLIQALEFALKDSIFAKRAELNGFNKNAVVELEERHATLVGLYYATLRVAVDTLQTERLKDNYYQQWKDRYFTDSVYTTFKAYVYPDSVAAWKTIQAWQKNRNFPKAVEESASHLTIEERTTKAKVTEIDGKPEHLLPMESDKMDQVFAGPYEEPNGTRILIAPVSRRYTYLSRQEAEERLEQAITKNLSQITHEQLLPKTYNRDEVSVDLKELDAIVPYYFKDKNN